MDGLHGGRLFDPGVGVRGDEPAGSEEAGGGLLAEYTPDEFTTLGLGYVAMESAPEDLLETYDFDTPQ